MLTCSLGVFVSMGSTAQVATYIFDGSTVGTYSAITGGTVLGSTANDDERFLDPATASTGTTATNTGVGFPIGFSFTYNGVAYDRFGVNSNGWMSLGRSAVTPSVNMTSTSSYTPLASTSTITPTDLRARIAGCAADLQGQTGSELRVQTIGTAPNQTLVVQWTNYRRYTQTGQNLTFQIRLNQANDVALNQTVEVVYGTMNFNTTTSTAHVGLGGSASTDFNNRTTTTNWNSTTAGTANSSSCTFESTMVTPPVTGRTFLWSAPQPCAGTPAPGSVPTPVSVCNGNTTVLTATGLTQGLNLTYQWEESPDGVSGWANVVGGTGAATATYTTTAVTATRYFRIRTNCANGPTTNTSNVVTVNPVLPVHAVFNGSSYLEGFESWASRCNTTDVPNTSWLNTPATGNNSWRRNDQGTSAAWTSTSGAYSPVFSQGAFSARFHSFNSSSGSKGNLDFYIDMTAGSGSNGLAFDYINTSGGDSLTILQSTDGGANFIRLGAILTTAATWTQVSRTITSTSATTVIRLRATSDFGGTDIGVDNFQITSPCAGTPVAGTVTAATTQCNTATAGSVISATGFTTGATQLSFQWEQSADGVSGWTNVTGGSGATTTTYTTPVLTTTTYYRMRITCANGGGTDVSSNVCTASVIFCTFDVTYTTGATWNSIMPANGGSGLPLSGWQVASNGDDNTSTTQSLAGTTFRYQGNLVTGFQMCSNGWMTFNTANTSTAFSNSLTSTIQNRVLAPFWDDLVFTGQSYANRDLCARYQVIGTLGSGSAVIVMEWAGLERYNIPGPNMNFQVRLYEGSNVIEYVYGDFQGYDGTYNTTNTAWTSSHSIGYNGSNPAGTTGADRFGMQTITRVTNHFAASDPGTCVGMPACFSKFTFTPGVYTGPTSTPAVPVPANDNSGNAITLTAYPAPCTTFCGTYFTSLGATDSGLGINGCSTTAGNEDDDVWFKFTASGISDYTLRLRCSPSYDGVLQLIGSDGTTNIACVNATGVGLIESHVATALPAGTYYVRIFHNGATVGASSGEFSLCLSEVVPPPANDDICGSANLPMVVPCSPLSGSTLSATASTTTPAPTCGTGSLVDVWYSFTATTTGDVITLQSGSGFNAAMAIYSSSDNSCSGTLTQVTCQNATSTAGAETYSGPWVAGNTYFVRVYHAAGGIGGSGAFTICRSMVAPVCATLSSPANGATVSTNPVPLTWNAANGATSYAVYVSLTNPPPQVTPTATVSVTNYDFVPSPYNACDVWYWTVVPSNTAGVASNQPCAVRSFNLASATCVAPTALTSSPTSTTSGVVSWTASVSSPGSYQLYWSTSATAPVCATAPTISNITGTSQAISGLPANATIYSWVRSNCGGSDLSAWAAAPNFFTGYCSATHTTVDELITNVTVGNINNTTTSPGAPLYSDFTSQVASMQAGQSYPISVTIAPIYTGDTIAVWVDWNGDLDFDDANELQVKLSAASGSVTSNIVVPASVSIGSKRMRVRLMYNTVPVPCGSVTYGETEDYTISICQQPNATVSIADNCPGDNFVITVNEATLPSGTINYTVDGVAQTPIAFTAPSTPLPAIADSSNVSISLANAGCVQNLGSFGSACPIQLNCSAPALNYTYCYKNSDGRTWTFTNPGGTVALKFVSGSMDVNDNILLWEGAVGGTPHATYPTLSGTLDGILVTSIGSTLSMSINSGASNSCFDGGQTAPWVFQARCGGCVEPSGFVTADPNENGFPEVDCGAIPEPTFNAYVGIIDNGIDANTGEPPATVGYRLYVNNVAQPDVTGLPGGEYYLLGTFPLNTDIDVTLLHEDQAGQSICNNPVATNFTVPFNLCPPANDQCVNAIDLTVNTPASCPANAVIGTTRGADMTGAAPTCGATPVQDVWYHINTVGFAQPILTVTDGTATVVGAQLFSACGTPLTGYCVADVTTGPIIVNAPQGEYWIRFFTTAAGAGTFSVCISAEVAGYECNGAINIPSIPVSNQSLVCSTAALPGLLNATNVPTVCGAASNNYKGGQEALYTYTATATGLQNITYSGQAWSAIFVYSGACPTNGGVCVGSVGSSATTQALQVNMVAGTTYYIWFDTWPTPNSPCTGTFSIQAPPAPPANDSCAGAITLTVNSGTSCTAQTAGTVLGATASSTTGQAVTPCLGTADDDVWYKFVATNTSHTISLNTVAGSVTTMNFAVYSGVCGTFTNIGCGPSSSTSSTTIAGLTIGATYHVRVYTNTATGGQTTTFNVCVTTPPPPPVNDDPCGAITLNVGTSCVFTQYTTSSATATAGQPTPSCASYAGGDVWFKVVVPAGGALNFDSNTGVILDLGMEIYSSSDNTCSGTMTAIECDDDDSVNGLMSYISRTGLTVGSTIFIRCWEYGNDNPGTFSICVSTPPLPPANDECAGAIALTVNPSLTCSAQTSGTILAATASAQATSPCSGTADDDVWYSFVATNTSHVVSLNNLAGSTTDMYFAVYGGTCGALSNVLCSDPESATVQGLTIGATYYVRVYTWTSTTGQTSTFNICISTPPPPPANDECAGAVNLPVSAGLTCSAQTAGTLQSATNSGLAVSPCSGTVNDDVWYRFTATATQHIITLSSIAPTTTLYMQLFDGTCGSFVHMSCATVNTYTTPALVAGNTYYFRVYSFGSTAVSTTFNVCVTTPPPGPPANDECAGALNLPVNLGSTCSNQTFGTVFGATASAGAVTPCSGTADDDVWFSFVAAGTSHTVSLNGVAGSVTSMNLAVYNGSCGTLTNIGCGATSATSSANVSGLVPGNTYYVRVYTNTATSGQNTTFNVCVTSPPANDLCANAIAVTCNSLTAGSTLGSSNTGNPGTCITDLSTAGGVWYTVQGWGGPMTASLCGASYDTKIGIFTGSCGAFTCVNGNDDDTGTGGAGVCGGGVSSSTSWTSTAGTTYYIYVTGYLTNVGTFNLTVRCGTTSPTCSANGLNLEFQNDMNPGQVSWQILNEAGTMTVLSGADPIPANSIGTQALCLPNGCYRLRVLDSAGDGMTTGGYELRTSGMGQRIIDNTNNYSSGSVSAIANGGSFCLPIGTVTPLWSSCDKLD
ncbi:MAG: hypothetical protein KDB95_04150, partial [Flavobacteriales bacterium]|nr:hypothetical protein [Flavobacteriales bacterium]